jgi:hypothetical protein
MVVLLNGSPISTEELWNSVRVTIGFMVTSPIKALLSRLLSLAGRPALGSLAGSKLLPFKIYGDHCVLGTFNAADMFWYPSRDLCLDTIMSWISTENYFDFMPCFSFVIMGYCVQIDEGKKIMNPF